MSFAYIWLEKISEQNLHSIKKMRDLYILNNFGSLAQSSTK